MAKVYNYFGHHIELDDETGMPKLPEGYFWRVKKDKFKPNDERPYIIEIRRKGLMFSHEVCHSWAEPTKDGVLDWAAFLIHNKFTPPKKAVEADISLLGDYPPKKLEKS